MLVEKRERTLLWIFSAKIKVNKRRWLCKIRLEKRKFESEGRRVLKFLSSKC